MSERDTHQIKIIQVELTLRDGDNPAEIIRAVGHTMGAASNLRPDEAQDLDVDSLGLIPPDAKRNKAAESRQIELSSKALDKQDANWRTNLELELYLQIQGARQALKEVMAEYSRVFATGLRWAGGVVKAVVVKVIVERVKQLFVGGSGT